MKLPTNALRRGIAVRTLQLSLVMGGALSGCIPGRRAAPPGPPPALATRLVLGLDGIDYRDIAAAQQRGMFAQFHPVSRVVSTFPSISDIAWHEIFGVQAPRGYQRIYYSWGYNAVIGELLDAIRPIEFENRMDRAFDAKFHHLGAYIISGKVARGEVNKDVKAVFEITGHRTVYEYNVGPDALQHTRGDLERYLQHLDFQLNALQVEYQRRTGRPLEIAVLSDHGHNRARDARLLPIVDLLKARGFRAVEQLRAPNDVAFSVDGVTTGFGMFCDPDSVASVAKLLAGLNGIDIVTVRETASRFRVLSGNESALVERRVNAGKEQFRYSPVAGDPLHYSAVMARMRAESALDGDGYATEQSWLRYTVTLEYPVAPPRIVRGHTSVTQNPAPILASLNDKYRVGLGMVAIANRLKPLGGTHGALSATNSLGILMTNFRDTHDALTTNVRDQLDGFDDLNPPDWKSPGARVTTTALLNADRLSPFHGRFPAPASPPIAMPSDGRRFESRSGDGRDSLSTTALRPGTLNHVALQGDVGIEMWLSPGQLTWAAETASFVVDVRKRNGEQDDSLPANRVIWPMRTVTQSTDQLHYFLPLDKIGLMALEPNASYEVRLALQHLTSDGRIPRSTKSKAITTIKVRTNDYGMVWPF